jgi:hypothetical protein
MRYRLAVACLFALYLPLAFGRCPPNCRSAGGDLYNLMVDEAIPVKAIEHEPIEVRFTLTRTSLTSVAARASGRVCPSDASGDCASNESIGLNQPWSGRIKMKAPTAGDALKILFCAKVPGDEDYGCVDGNETANGTAPFASMASYEVLLESFHILHTKARSNDSVKAALYGNALAATPADLHTPKAAAPDPEAALCSKEGGIRYCASMTPQGTRVAGTISSVLGDMRVGPFLLAAETDDELAFWYVLLNAGFSSNEQQYLEMMKVLNAMGAGTFSTLMSSQGGSSSNNSAGTDLLMKGTDDINHALVPDCDSVVVNGYRAQTNKTVQGVIGQSLEARTRQLGFYRGGNSDDARDLFTTKNMAACGGGAEYKVTWRIARTSWQPPLGVTFSSAPVALPPVSDDWSAQFCPQTFGITALKCEGRFCDAISATCTPFGFDSPRGHREADQHNWSNWYSEEGTGLPNGISTQATKPFGLLTALECRGRFCDAIRVDADARGPVIENTCTWLPEISEETGPAQCPSGQYVGNIQCRGSNCDNLRVQCCTVRRP